MVRDRDEIETFDFQSETRSRPTPSPVSMRPRRDRDVWKLRLEAVSRPRLRDRDYIPDNNFNLAAFLFSSHPKRERGREVHLNYYTSAYNRGDNFHESYLQLVNMKNQRILLPLQQEW